MRKSFAWGLIAFALGGCRADLNAQSDVQACVDAHIAAYEDREPFRSADTIARMRAMADGEPMPKALGQEGSLEMEITNKYGLTPLGVTAEQGKKARTSELKAEYYLLCLRAEGGRK